MENIIKVCNKSPLERVSDEIVLLTKLTKNCKVFRNLIESGNPEIHYQCCKYIKYEFCDQNEYLFKFGDTGTRFYIILSGVVSVEVQKKDRYGDIYYTEFAQLETGSSFGELALESKKKRAASIKCKVPSHFMYLEKSDYVNLVGKLVQEKRNSLVFFLQSLPVFKSLTKGSLTKITYVFKEKNYNKGQIVYSEGDQADEIFIVKQGEFDVYKMIGKNSLKIKGKEIGNKVHMKNMKIGSIGVGEIIGAEDSLKDKLRITSCKCVSDFSVVVCIAKNVIFIKDFIKQVLKDEVLEYVENVIAKKNHDIQSRVSFLTRIENDGFKREKETHKQTTTALCLDIESNSEEFSFFKSLDNKKLHKKNESCSSNINFSKFTPNLTPSVEDKISKSLKNTSKCDSLPKIRINNRKKTSVEAEISKYIPDTSYKSKTIKNLISVISLGYLKKPEKFNFNHLITLKKTNHSNIIS